MSRFGENYRGLQFQVLCPLCGLYPDNQEGSFTCEKIKLAINIEGNISDIYKEDINACTLQSL